MTEAIAEKSDVKGAAEASAFGRETAARIVRALDLKPAEEFSDIAELQTQQGAPGGHVRIYRAPGIEKVVDMSMELVAGMRYFFVHIVPDASLDAPRYVFDSVVTVQGTRASIDLYPDFDMTSDIDCLTRKFAGLNRIYDAAIDDTEIVFSPSRLAHIRAVCSPFFLGVFSAQHFLLPKLEVYAQRYFDEWRNLFSQAKSISAAKTQQKRARREVITEAIVGGDYMRRTVSDIYGHEIARKVEQALAP